ncbi:hypothetical protein SAMN04488238_102247 [Roseicitreum antarcticum]|uniref:Uncharacterized protein n=1 Tax=Roseicitreum antarcticum TaxID=564137 RepID=A0A1H2U140_9RHOB|nr:hypothetical protein SAMN04488238_102247 [Roseicitreum antarcticum]
MTCKRDSGTRLSEAWLHHLNARLRPKGLIKGRRCVKSPG